MQLDSVQNQVLRIPIFSPQHQNQYLQISSKTRISQIKQKTIQKLGYASRIYFYQLPLCSHHQLDFFNDQATIEQVISTIKLNQQQQINIAILYNNTQYRQQPDYYNSKNIIHINKQESYQIVLQIMQNNFFVHQNLLIPATKRLSIVRSMAQRYGGSIYLQYYNARMALNQFSNSQTQILGQWLDSANKLTVSTCSIIADIQDEVGSLRQIKTSEWIDFQKFYIIQLKDKEQKKYIINRKSNFQSMAKILELITAKTYKYSFDCQSFFNITDQPIQIAPQKKIIYFKYNQLSAPFIRFDHKILNAQLITSPPKLIGNQSYITLLFIESSSIFHRLTISLLSNKICNHITTQLPCPQTQLLDEDLFYINPITNNLLGYSITIHGVKLKQYTINGKLLSASIQDWVQGQIQFKVNDFFCIKPKLLNNQHQKSNQQKYLTVFYIDQPSKQVLIQNPICDGFFPARIGFNSTSDGSGIFAIWRKFYRCVSVYKFDKQVSEKCGKIKPMFELKTQNQNIVDIFFSWSVDKQPHKFIAINYDNKMIEIVNMKGQKMANILCMNNMQNFIFIQQKLISFSQAKISQFQLKKGHWQKPKYVPPNHLIVHKPTKKVIVPKQKLQYQIISGIYFY